MNNNYLILLCTIIVIFAMMSLYKIETFQVDLSQTTVAQDIPNNPNNFSCLEYLENIKKWPTSTYEKTQKKMLAALRTSLANRKTDLFSNNPYTNACILPKEHLQTFGINSDCTVNKNTIKDLGLLFENKYNVSDGDDNAYIHPDKIEEIEKSFDPNSNLFNHELKDLKTSVTPNGCTIDFQDTYKDQKKFKDLLRNMDVNFNYKYIMEINQLMKQINGLQGNIKQLRQTKLQYNRDISQLRQDVKDVCNDNIEPICKEDKFDYFCKINIRKYITDTFDANTSDPDKHNPIYECNINSIPFDSNNTYNRKYTEFINTFIENRIYWFWTWAFQHMIDVFNKRLPQLFEDIEYFRNIYATYSPYMKYPTI
jgi:hypothetical protein